MDSSSASSPISSRSTIASSPEATTSGGEVSTSGPGKNRYPSMVGVQTERMVQGMDAAYGAFRKGHIICCNELNQADNCQRFVQFPRVHPIPHFSVHPRRPTGVSPPSLIRQLAALHHSGCPTRCTAC